jgi:hypothetical protein
LWLRAIAVRVPRPPDFYATVFATTPGRFEVSGTRLSTGDSFKWKRRFENKRHTNTYLPLTSHSSAFDLTTEELLNGFELALVFLFLVRANELCETTLNDFDLLRP